MQEQNPWERIGLGPDQPLTDLEQQLLTRFEAEGTKVLGLRLERRADGSVFIASFAPSESTRGTGLTLVQLGEGGSALFGNGQYLLAAVVFTLSLRLAARHFGSAHDDTLTLANNLAQAVSAQGLLTGARGIQEIVLETRQRIFGAEHPGTLTSAHNLAAVLGAQGDLTGARRLEEYVLDARRRTQGTEHPDTLTAASNLGNTLCDQGELIDGLKIHKEVYEKRKRIFGDEHLDTQTSASCLASAHAALGDIETARGLQESVFETRKRLLGVEHPSTLSAACNLAQTLSEQGDRVGARSILELVLESRRRVLGSEHPDTLTSSGNLAEVLRNLGDLSGARNLHESVLEIRKRLLGFEHPDTLISAGNLATTLLELNDLVGARRIQEMVLETHQRVLGPKHPHTLISGGNLASTLSEQGDFAGARGVHEWVLEARKQMLGAEHPDTLISAGNLATALCALGDLDTARGIAEFVFDARTRVLGVEHPDSLTAASNLARILWSQGDVAGARIIEESVFETRRRVLGAEHPGTLISANNLAVMLRELGYQDRAFGLHKSAFDTMLDVLGKVHRETLVSARNLAITLQDQGKLDECLGVCIRAMQALAEAPRVDSSALLAATEFPVLTDLNRDWPVSTVTALPQLLLSLSESVRAQLTSLPVDQAEPLYKALLTLHWRWAVFASYKLPESARIDETLRILAPLHGTQAWLEIGHEAVQSALKSSGPEDPAAHFYAKALESAQQLREQLNAALQQRAHSNQTALGLQHRLSRIRNGEGDEANAVATDPSLALRLQAAWESSRQSAEAARLALEDLTVRSGVANAAVKQALDALAADNPDLKSLAQQPVPTQAGIQAGLAEDELWLVPLPCHLIKPDLDKLNEQAANNPSFVLAVRRGQAGQIVNTLPSSHLSLYSDWCRGSVRLNQRGLLRDGGPGLELARQQPMQVEPLELLRSAAQAGFWNKLSPMLHGIRCIHLVTAFGWHDLMLEPGRPAELADVVLHRYCGLPAYWRRSQRERRADRPALRYGWIHDEGWDSGSPILFTPLDSIYLSHRGLGQPQSLQDLHDHGPAADVLVISSHGYMGSDGSARGGRLVIGGQALSALSLPRRRNPGDLQAEGEGLRGLIALSCFGGVVGSTGHGDALGFIATLQAAGLEWAVACLAPVADFYTPLFSAVLLHQMQAQDDPALALENAKHLVTKGAWDRTVQQEVIEPLRQAYRQRMLDLLHDATALATDEAQARRQQQILGTVRGWSLPGAYRRALSSMGVEEILPNSAEGQEAFVDDCLDVLLRAPQERSGQDEQEDGYVVQALEHLAAVAVFFGRG